MTELPHTYVTPDLPPAVEVPDLPGAHVRRDIPSDGDRQDRKQGRPSAATEERDGKATD